MDSAGRCHPTWLSSARMLEPPPLDEHRTMRPLRVIGVVAVGALAVAEEDDVVRLIATG